MLAFDPYYSNAGYDISLTDESIAEVSYEDEDKRYQPVLYSISSTAQFFSA